MNKKKKMFALSILIITITKEKSFSNKFFAINNLICGRFPNDGSDSRSEAHSTFMKTKPVPGRRRILIPPINEPSPNAQVCRTSSHYSGFEWTVGQNVFFVHI